MSSELLIQTFKRSRYWQHSLEFSSADLASYLKIGPDRGKQVCTYMKDELIHRQVGSKKLWKRRGSASELLSKPWIKRRVKEQGDHSPRYY